MEKPRASTHSPQLQRNNAKLNGTTSSSSSSSSFHSTMSPLANCSALFESAEFVVQLDFVGNSCHVTVCDKMKWDWLLLAGSKTEKKNEGNGACVTLFTCGFRWCFGVAHQWCSLSYPNLICFDFFYVLRNEWKILWLMQEVSDSHGNHSIFSSFSVQTREKTPNVPLCHPINMQRTDLFPDVFLSLYLNIFSGWLKHSLRLRCKMRFALKIGSSERYCFIYFILIALYAKLKVDSSHAFTFAQNVQNQF